MSASPSASPGTAPPLPMLTRIQLSVMMFLQFAIWGAWFVYFYQYVKNVGFDDGQAGYLIGNMALGAIFANLFAGYLADRLMSSEYMMAVCHLIGAGLLYWATTVQDPEQFGLLFGIMLGYALVYNPTLALSNAIAFRHVPDATRDFPSVRVLGTVGWIAAGLASDYLYSHPTLGPDGTPLLDAQGEMVMSPASTTSGPLLLAAGLSAVLGVFSLLLPKTPPTGKAGDAIPFAKALRLFKDPSFAVFFGVSLVITVGLAFYYTVTGEYLEKRVGVTNTGFTLSLGQMCEFVFMLLLPLFLYRIGMKWVLALGMACWVLRYVLFSQGGPSDVGYAIVIGGILLHGLCYDFFFAAGFIHVDNEAPKDIRASGQALFTFLTYGVGMWLGNVAAGKLKAHYTDSVTGVTDWQSFWLVPAGGVLACLVVFILLFRTRKPSTSIGTDSPTT